MSKFSPTYKPFGSSAILIVWPQEISNEILVDIINFVKKIEIEISKQIIEVNFVYNSLLVVYNNLKINYIQLKSQLEIIYNEPILTQKVSPILWNIPVCYDQEFGIDLALLSKAYQLDIHKIITLHSGAIYTVFGIGFLPGFLYLGGLSKNLNFPRKQTPRTLVSKGSVGIGENQTGIYPQDSPGGWNIIGKTPALWFNPNTHIPCKIAPNDKIQFFPISIKEFKEIEILAKSKEGYTLKSTIYND